MPILTGEEHNCGLVLGSALQIVEYVVRADIGEHFTDTGKKQHVVISLSNTLANGRDQVLLDVEYSLQKLQQSFSFFFSIFEPEIYKKRI